MFLRYLNLNADSFNGPHIPLIIHPPHINNQRNISESKLSRSHIKYKLGVYCLSSYPENSLVSYFLQKFCNFGKHCLGHKSKI